MKAYNLEDALIYITNVIYDYCFDYKLLPNLDLDKSKYTRQLEKIFKHLRDNESINLKTYILKPYFFIEIEVRKEVARLGVFSRPIITENQTYINFKKSPMIEEIGAIYKALGAEDTSYHLFELSNEDCIRCGSVNEKLHKGLCYKCYHKDSAKHLVKSINIGGGVILKGSKEIERHKAFIKRRNIVEQELKEGKRFICVRCKKPTHIEKKAKTKNDLCTSCAKFFYDENQEKKILDNKKQANAMIKKKRNTNSEDLAKIESNSNSMIEEFLKNKVEA